VSIRQPIIICKPVPTPANWRVVGFPGGDLRFTFATLHGLLSLSSMLIQKKPGSWSLKKLTLSAPEVCRIGMLLSRRVFLD
jgi:hypothetical protein